jgi:hypothetical protein
MINVEGRLMSELFADVQKVVARNLQELKQERANMHVS